jgi:Domain of unknown function (DUF4328)/Protein of unknown function (DUF2510)
VSDEVSGYPGAPPGWYADPAGGPGQRWWDGYSWTEATVLPSAQPPPPSSSGAPPPPVAYLQSQPWTPYSGEVSGLLQREVAFTPLARVALIFYGLNILVGLIDIRFHQAQLRTQGHQFRAIVDASRNGQPTPQFSDQTTADPVQLVLGLVAIIAIIFALIWQFRAASTARALGIPATHSPGWGVGCWFVPIVNFWMPYQAVRDCLPPDDPNRGLVLRWWLIFLCTWSSAAAAMFAAWFSGGVSLVISIVAALLGLAFLATAPRMVVAISAQHQNAIDRSVAN